MPNKRELGGASRWQLQGAAKWPRASSGRTRLADVQQHTERAAEEAAGRATGAWLICSSIKRAAERQQGA